MKAKMLWVVHVGLVAAWLLMNGMSSFSTDALTQPEPYPLQRYQLSSDRSTNPRQTYRDVISGIRRILTNDRVFEIPRLADRNTVPRTRRFILLELINEDRVTITLAIETDRLYIVGYRRPDEFHYFPDLAAVAQTLFPDLPQDRRRELPFTTNYAELGDRQQTRLGLSRLNQAIDHLHRYHIQKLGRAFLVIAQMISEAIRFRYIERYVGRFIGNGVEEYPHQTMLDLENRWDALSSRIQNSANGTLNPAVVLTHRDGHPRRVTEVEDLGKLMGILLFACNRPRNNANQLSLISTEKGFSTISEPIIRLPTEKGSAHLEAAGGTCKLEEPTIRIIGRNGLCADVRDGLYNDGDPIILWPCKSNEDVNQLWTLKADGTIRSNGKCLTTYGSDPGSYIMIYDCSTAVPVSTKWVRWDNGTIINPESSLVLTATSGNAKTTLTVQKNVYASSQAWVVSNNTQPTVTTIMNNNEDMCLEAPDSVFTSQIIYGGCQSGESRQSFALYPDGSIRPDEKRHDCLTADMDNSVVVTAECNGGAEQRWSFNRDYTISNLNTGLVMDAQTYIIYLSTRELKESQEWLAWLL